MAEAMISDEYKESNPDLLQLVKNDPDHCCDEKNVRPKGLTSDTRTVVIKVPPKRRKVSTSVSTKQIIDLISTCVSPEERDEAISVAVASFDHSVQSVHDEELAAGADSALTKHLGFILAQSFIEQKIQPKVARQGYVSLLREVSYTCTALEMIYRANTSMVARSFHQLGDELLPFLNHVIDEEIKVRVHMIDDEKRTSENNPESASMSKSPTYSEAFNEYYDHSENDEARSRSVTPPQCVANSNSHDDEDQEQRDVILRKATKILGHFARVGAATQPIAYHHGLLSSLISLVSLQPYDAIPAEARMNSLWIMANLACNAENMVMMACHPGLISSLISMTFRSMAKHDSVETILEVLRSQSIAARALLNLSWAPENRIPMSENVSLVQVLTPLAVMRKSPFGNRGRTINEVILQTRRHAVGTLRNLAAAPRRNKLLLCNFGKGLLLNVLTDAVLNDPDEGVKARAFATIHNLAIHDTAVMMVENPALVLALKDALQETTDNGEDDSLRASASGTLLVLERSITPDMECYQNLRELLDAVNPTGGDDDSDMDDMHVDSTPV